MHNQGLHQLFLMMSWNFCSKFAAKGSLYLLSSRSNQQGQVEGLWGVSCQLLMSFKGSRWTRFSKEQKKSITQAMCHWFDLRFFTYLPPYYLISCVLLVQGSNIYQTDYHTLHGDIYCSVFLLTKILFFSNDKSLKQSYSHISNKIHSAKNTECKEPIAVLDKK